MSPFGVFNALSTRRQPDHVLIPPRKSDEIQTREQRRKQFVYERSGGKQPSGRDLRPDLANGKEDTIVGTPRRSATVSYSRGKRGSRINDDSGRETEKSSTATATAIDHASEDKDHVVAEDKRFSWGSFRRRRKRHTSTDTQKQEYGEHNFSRWSRQIPSVEVVSPHNPIDTTPPGDGYLLPAIQDAPSPTTGSAIDQMGDQEHRKYTDTTHTTHMNPKTAIEKPLSEFTTPLVNVHAPDTYSYGDEDGGPTSGYISIKPSLKKILARPVTGSSGLPEPSSAQQHAREKIMVRSMSVTQPQAPRWPSVGAGADDEDNALEQSGSGYVPQSNADPSRRFPRRSNHTRSAALQIGRSNTTQGLVQSHPHNPHHTEQNDDYSGQNPLIARQQHGHREAIMKNRKIEGRIHPQQVASASTLGYGLTKTDLPTDTELSRPYFTERPYSFARSLINSVASGDFRPEDRFSLGRSTLNSEIQPQSTSFMSLPTTYSESGAPGPRSHQYLPLGDMEFRLVRVLPETMSTLKCELCHRSLHDAMDYIAISYAWGDGVRLSSDTERLFRQSVFWLTFTLLSSVNDLRGMAKSA